jgi:hypothetical protein
MAIVIPSKNIYKREPQKQKNNNVDGISFKPTRYLEENTSGVVYTESEGIKTNYFYSFPNENSVAKYRDITPVESDDTFIVCAASYCGYREQGYVKKNVSVPISSENKKIVSVSHGVNEDGIANISITANYEIAVGKAKAICPQLSESTSSFQLTDFKYTFDSKGEFANEIPSTITNSKSNSSVNHLTAESTVELSRGIENVKTIKPTKKTVNGNDFFVFEGLTFLSRVFLVKLGFEGSNSQFQNAEFSGTYERYTLKSATITINGESKEIKVGESETVFVGADSGNLKTISEGNEFIEYGAYEDAVIRDTVDIDVDIGFDLSESYSGTYTNRETNKSGDLIVSFDLSRETPIATYSFYGYFNEADRPNGSVSLGDRCDVIYEDGSYDQEGGHPTEGTSQSLVIAVHSTRRDIKTFKFYGGWVRPNINEYGFKKAVDMHKNGKETAEMSVSISDYYDENGDIVISTKNGALKPLFDINDVVIPMVYAGNGKDVPTVANGNEAKKFVVVGSKLVYDGSVLQHLKLIEE